MNTLYYADIVCSIIAMVAIVSALLVISQAVHNPVNSVLWLIVSFVAVACYLITAGITFIGLSYIIVYVGAIAVLFLFVVIILNLANQDLSESRGTGYLQTKNMWPVAFIILAIGTLSVLPLSQHINFVVDIPVSILDLINGTFINNPLTEEVMYNPISVSQISPISQVQMLGITLYTYGSLWLLIVSVLLILAILVPLALAFTT